MKIKKHLLTAAIALCALGASNAALAHIQTFHHEFLGPTNVNMSPGSGTDEQSSCNAHPATPCNATKTVTLTFTPPGKRTYSVDVRFHDIGDEGTFGHADNTYNPPDNFQPAGGMNFISLTPGNSNYYLWYNLVTQGTVSLHSCNDGNNRCSVLKSK
jgi:hypothetical protein